MERVEGKRILVTGGAGMIGSAIARLAVREGARVTILDAMLPLYGGNHYNLREVKDDIEFIYGDIRDEYLMRDVVKGRDVIFNLAAQVSYIDSNEMPLYDLDINCKGHLNVLECCRLYNPEARLVFSSSRFVYGATLYNPVDEKHPFRCLAIYGVHKLNGEKYYQFYHRAHGLSTVIFRIANPYGPGQQMKHSKYGIVNWFIRLALEGNPLTVYGDGSQKRDYVYVEDLARAMLLGAVDDRVRHDVFNLGSGTGTSFAEMTQVVAGLVPGTEVTHVPWPEKRAFVETGDYVTDLSHIKKILDWSPRWSLKDGIAATVDYYREHLDHYLTNR